MKIDFEKFPQKCGVYIFKDTKGNPIYIGKAKNIKKRIQSHFNEILDPRKEKLLEETETIDFLVTPNEISALFLENSLIKKHKPKYNVNLKDDKTYPYIAITINEKYPKILYTRKIKEGSIYFGPFYPARKAKLLISFIQKNFGIPGCKRNLNKNYKRPCLYYYLKRCLGPCVEGLTNKFEYQKKLKQAILLLKGKDKKLLNEIRKEIEEKAKKLKFEEAKNLREVYNSINEIKKIIGTEIKGIESKDVFGVYREGTDLSCVVLNIKGGKILDKKNYLFERIETLDLKTFLNQIIPQYYLSNPIIPEKIIVPVEINEEIFLDFLKEIKGKKVNVLIPKKGKDYKLLKLAEENAKEFYSFKVPKKEMEKLKEIIKTEKLNSIIGVDVSHFSGEKRYGSLVWFENGNFEKKKYRIFKLKSSGTKDDPGGINEILFRYFKKSSEEKRTFPDLILIDGGKAQLSAGIKALNELKISIPIISIEKGEEKIYIQKEKDPLILKKGDPALLLLMKIRDEAHRFAIKYHRKASIKIKKN